MSSRSDWTRRWLPLLLWMAVIFTASTDAFSSNRTSRFIGPLLRWFAPSISDNAVRRVQFAVRKSGHAIGYAVLAILTMRALGGVPQSPSPRHSAPAGLNAQPWAWRPALLSLAGCAAYAVTDELHQGLVASRQASVGDVFLDTAGAAGGLLLHWIWWRRGSPRPPPT